MSVLLVEVRRSPGFTVLTGGFIAACSMALFLSASAVAGPLAGTAAALAGAVWLVWRVRREGRGRPRCFWLAGDGSVGWYDRMGRPGAGQVVAAVRAGGLWVSLSAQRSELGTPLNTPSRTLRGTGAGMPGVASLLARRLGRRPCAWLLPADAMAPETFRELAVRVPHAPRGRP